MIAIKTGREAAERYAQDELFAQEFDARLAELFRDQAKRLERLAARLEMGPHGSRPQVNSKPVAAEEPEAGGTTSPIVPLQKIVDVLKRTAGREGMTRGALSTYLEIDSSDSRLTRALRVLKEDGTIKQVGTRRSARYLLSASGRAR